jgi:uncharacterized membrane protein
MSTLNLVLHVLHIVAGVVWAGGAIIMGLFVSPAVMATRPESGRFMQQLTGPGKLPVWMMIAAWVTVICGVTMFAPAMGALDPGVMRTPRGIALSLGALIGLGAFLEGMLVNAPSAQKIGRIGAAIAASGKGPTPEQLQQMQALQNRLAKGTQRGAVMLLLTVTLMAAARWL